MDKQRTRKKELELENAAMAWETKDFNKDGGHRGVGTVAKARKNRQCSLYRIISLCDEISDTRYMSFPNDFLVWDHACESRYASSDSGSSHANFHANIVTKLMADLRAGKGEEVAAWWEERMAKFPQVVMSLPASSASK